MKTLKIVFLFSVVFCLVACTGKNPAGETAKMDYTLPAKEYKTRMKASNSADWRPVKLKVDVPTGGVALSEHGVFKPYMERNISYLLNSLTVNHMMQPFWLRAGKEVKPDARPQIPGWETDLRGASTGRFLMGAGNSLRWIEHEELRARLNEIIDILEDCREPNGYILPYHPIIDSIRGEEPNYARAWLTHGLIDAAIAGNPKAYGLLRGHADWFNKWDEMHPKLIYWGNNSHQGYIASTRTYLSPIGKPEDLQIAEKYYVCDWWINELAAKHEEAIWKYPLQNPHSYLITSFEAYLDHYIATGDKTYLNAMLGAWEMIHDDWEHVGGSIAICENQWTVEDGKRVFKHADKAHVHDFPPHSYYITERGHTGETCGSAFWIKFNQRLHRLFPDEEKYKAEIEKSIYNVILANQIEDGLILYHAAMQGCKIMHGTIQNTCCEGQGTRLLGSLPEYIYSIADDGLYVNLYEASSIDCKIAGKPVGLTLESRFPFNPDVAITVSVSSPLKMNLRIRIPSWASKNVGISVNGKLFATGKPGTCAELSRNWENGDKVEFTLPMSFHFTQYSGMEALYPKERIAVEYGPILLASVKNGEISDVNGIPNLTDRLVPDADRPLYFSVKGDSLHRFMPYWLLSGEPFSVYESTVQIPEIDLSAYLSSPDGFTVEFYNNPGWEGKPVYRGTTKNLYFASGYEGDKPVAPGVNLTNYSSRFEGEFIAPAAGEVIFSINADDGHWFYIDGKCVSENEQWTNGYITCKLDAVKGQKYRLKLEHRQSKGRAMISLRANMKM